MFSEIQFYKMCDFNMSQPIKLIDADFEKSFVYDRKYGLFYVPAGYHQHALSLLLAFHHGLNSSLEISEKLNLKQPFNTADYFLETTHGTCFKSSVSKKITCASSKHLSTEEFLIFKKNGFSFDFFMEI